MNFYAAPVIMISNAGNLQVGLFETVRIEMRLRNYSAGLRSGEAVRLKANTIDSQHQLIHIRPAKGKKDRYTLLSDVVPEKLRDYYRRNINNWIYSIKMRLKEQ